MSEHPAWEGTSEGDSLPPLVNFKAHADALDGLLETPMGDAVTLLEWVATWERDGTVFHGHVFLKHEQGQPRLREIVLIGLGRMLPLQSATLTGADAAAWFALDAVPYREGFWTQTKHKHKSGLVIAQAGPVYQKRND